MLTLLRSVPSSRRFFFFNDTATTEIYTLSLHDALPISLHRMRIPGQHGLLLGFKECSPFGCRRLLTSLDEHIAGGDHLRSEEHTSELQSRPHLVCRLLLETKKSRSMIRTWPAPTPRLAP